MITSLPNLFFKSFQAGFTRFSVSHPVVGGALSSGNYSQVPEIPFESEQDTFSNPKGFFGATITLGYVLMTQGFFGWLVNLNRLLVSKLKICEIMNCMIFILPFFSYHCYPGVKVGDIRNVWYIVDVCVACSFSDLGFGMDLLNTQMPIRKLKSSHYSEIKYFNIVSQTIIKGSEPHYWENKNTGKQTTIFGIVLIFNAIYIFSICLQYFQPYKSV